MNSAIIRQGELVGMGLMAYETTEEVGSVDHLLVNVVDAEVVGFACKSGGPLGGMLGRKQAVSWSQLVKVGRDRIIIHTAVPPSEAIENQLAAAQNVTGLEVWTDGGDCIGQVVDFCLEVGTGKVQQYLFALDLRKDAPDQDSAEAGESEEPESVEVFAIAPATIISAGRKRMMIAEEDARRAQPYDQRLTIGTSKAERASDWRSEQLPTDFNDVLQGAQSFAGKVSDRVKQQAKKFSDEQFSQRRRPGPAQPDDLPEITEQLQAKTEQVKQQMQRQFEQAKKQARGQVEGKLNDSPMGRSISEKLGARLDKFVRPQSEEPEAPIDVEAFEVWEDD
ncbi:MAG: hypothetical protein DCF25_11765 [Leptolyngbya foveolarum]|uniref:PRC-barrel domain-containing protein n=1 Tax=Leptolyngbya foveolarum TaxID=47253 RepID=A0A2W4U7S0_9CYAN|nr:MAG: hypothetical protein DCF25_11765 [Leptolyngbya foveolarum]